MLIIGAGLSGLLAGALDRGASILEAQPALPFNHHAVLRFREDKIGKALNIPFRKVRVLKAVWDGRNLKGHITPRDANNYSRKVTGKVVARSIINLEPSERYIAPRDFIQQLAKLCEGRITYNHTITHQELLANYWGGIPTVSTIPLPVLCDTVGIDTSHVEFLRSGIKVFKMKLPEHDVFQTVYNSDPDSPVYRATITGSELAIEATEVPDDEYLREVGEWFGVGIRLDAMVLNDQRYGKILPLPDPQRKSLLLKLTQEFGIYSLGRFACWRNILLDDVYDDFAKVRRMIDLKDHYDNWSTTT